jgi:hypothetical protein
MTVAVVTIAFVVLAAAIFVFLRIRSKDFLEELIAKRRPSSRLVTRARLEQGLDEIPVALSLTADSIVYENRDLEALLELRNVEEVEYDDETATGRSVTGKALRLRSHGQTFEFVIDQETARQWQAALPMRRLDQGTAQAV